LSEKATNGSSLYVFIMTIMRINVVNIQNQKGVCST